MADRLTDLLRRELENPVAPEILRLAEFCRARHDWAAIGVLFYGACLWREAAIEDFLVDFYLLVEDYRLAYRQSWLALANRLLPPNVFYVEMREAEGRVLRAKYAVLTYADFRAGCRIEAPALSIWARFSQPARLVWARNPDFGAKIADAQAIACRSFLRMAHPLIAGEGGRAVTAERDWRRLWRTGFAATYAAEIRPEGRARTDSILEAAPDRYRQIAELVFSDPEIAWLDRGHAVALWRRKRWVGKVLNAARLLKAVFTFDGAIDYALYKLARHSGIGIEASPWQKRHPILAMPSLLWKLWRAGAFRRKAPLTPPPRP